MITAPTFGADARAHRAAETRAWLGDLWGKATGGVDPHGVALAFVGSYARGEPGPHSDLDLVLLHDAGSQRSGRVAGNGEIGDLADRLWYPMWDKGIRVDHSVRTVAECRAVAESDLSAAVALLDLSFVAGDSSVVETARTAVAHDWRKASRGRLGEVVAAVSARHTRFGDAAHLLAPHLKESRGGLRDMTVLRALTAAWLADRPHGDVDAAYRRLLDVRDALHDETGRAREVLDRDALPGVAARLRLDGPDDALRHVFAAARVVAYALDGTVRRASQGAAARRLRIGPRRPQLRPLGHGFFEHEGEVVIGPGLDPAASALQLSLRAAATAASAGLPLSRATLTHVARDVATAPPTWDATARDLLGRVLAGGPALVPLWEALDLAGIMSVWLPEWNLVRCLPQHNPVHRHTVDRHSIEAVAAATALLRDVARPDLLLVAALLHDLGKAHATHAHPAAGVAIARTVLDRWGMPSADAQIVLTLIAEHLTLAELATRRDPDDPATVRALADAVGGDLAMVDLLRALTVADARATGGAAWTSWRGRLIEQLVVATRTALSSAQRAPRPSEDGATAEGDLGRHLSRSPAGVEVDVVPAEPGVYRLQVVAPDRVGLFADVAGLLAVAGYAVLSARVRTDGAVAVQQWHVEGDGGTGPDAVEVARNLGRLTAGDTAPLRRLARHTSSVVPGNGAPAGTRSDARADVAVTVIPGASATATVLEVRAADRLGLLHRIGGALVAAGVSVRSAHVETLAGQASDTFYLTDSLGGPLPATLAERVVVGVTLAISEQRP